MARGDMPIRDNARAAGTTARKTLWTKRCTLFTLV
jgi:hypothetical protein